MKNSKITKITALLFSLIMAIVLGTVIGVAPLAMFGGLSVLSVISLMAPQTAGVFMAVQKEIWLNDIVENIFKANPFLNYCVNADQFVLAGKVLHIPQSGAKVGVSKNRDTSTAATVTLRSDTDITMALDEYTSDPIKISNADKYELSYDKRQSVLMDSQQAISELVGDWILRQWSPGLATNIIRTTGATVAAHVGTGTRKALTVADVKMARKVLNKMGVPKQERYLQLDADMYEQLTDNLTVTQERDFSKALDEKEGTVLRMFTFDIFEPRANVISYTNAEPPVAKDPDAVEAATDCAAAIAYQKNSVIRAMGTHEFFENVGDPQWYGDIYSALMRAVGRIRRSDQKGVVAIVQTLVS